MRHDPANAPVPPYYPDTPDARADWGRYYDVITAMDRRIGDVLGQLREDNLEDDTIVIFLSDNGPRTSRQKNDLYRCRSEANDERTTQRANARASGRKSKYKSKNGGQV